MSLTKGKSSDLWQTSERTLRLLVFVGVFLCLLQIWLPTYFVSGDGPCHIANARVIHDLWNGEATGFYKKFYYFNLHPHPNWLSHLLLASLLYIVNGLVAEKLLVTGYVLLMVTGLYKLLRQFGGSLSYWPVVLFLFVFHNLVAQGFYNFSYSIAFYCLMVYSWLRYLDERKPGRLAGFFVLLLLTYFSHPVAFVFGGVTCGALALTHSLASKDGAGGKLLLRILLALGVCNIPFLLLFAKFADRQSGNARPHLHFAPERLTELLSFGYLVNYDSKEVFCAVMAGVVFCATFVFSIMNRIKMGKGVQQYDGLLLTLLFGLSLFLVLPNNMLGGGALTARLGLFSLLLMAFCVAYIPMKARIINLAALLVFSYSAILSVVRLGINLNGSALIEDHQTVAKYIKPNSVVLPLHFATYGKDNKGGKITDLNNVFAHEGQYLGMKGQVIVLDNYEANTWYFPLRWTDETNPYFHLNRNKGIEGVPPDAAINEYYKNRGVAIDYILLLCFDSVMNRQPEVRALTSEINAGYHVVFTSPEKQAVLLQRN